MTKFSAISPASIEELRMRAISAVNAFAAPIDQDFPYETGPVEPVLESLIPGKAWVVKNRNGQGVLVTPSLLPMIDKDFKAHPELKAMVSDERVLMEDLDSLRRGTLEPLQMRIYRTVGGVRILIESPGLHPCSDTFALLADVFGCDENYLALCQKQHCFRHRLTPKAGRSPKGFRVCQYIGTLGENQEVNEETQWLVRFHDNRTKALSHAGEPLG